MQRRRWVSLGLIATVQLGCHAAARDARSKNALQSLSALAAPDLGAEVARVGEQAIYATEVAAQAAKRGITAAAALDELTAFALLAARSGAAPVEGEAEKQRLVERLLERDFEPTIGRDKLPQEDLEKAYKKVEFKFVHPRLVEVALLSVYTGPTMKPEPRARATEAGHDLDAHVRRNLATIHTAADFEAIANDPAWTARRVKYWRFFQGPDRKNGPFGANVGGAIAKLHKPGEVSPLIEDDSGYHIAQYISESPARNTPFAEARDEIADAYFPVWRRQRFLEWTRVLGSSHTIEMFPDRAIRPATP